jgi:hypothetical protein
MKKIDFEKSCEICGGVAFFESRLNPDGFLYSKNNGGLIVYEKHYYCANCLEKSLNNLMERVKNKW